MSSPFCNEDLRFPYLKCDCCGWLEDLDKLEKSSEKTVDINAAIDVLVYRASENDALKVIISYLDSIMKNQREIENKLETVVKALMRYLNYQK